MTADTTPHEELREQLAAIEHERWSDWQAYCHKVLRENITSCPQIEVVLERWDKQIATPYEKLSDSEKASDMEQVDRYWPLITRLIERKVLEGKPGWQIELPNLPYFQIQAFQIQAFDDKDGKWSSPIYNAKNLPVQLNLLEGKK